MYAWCILQSIIGIDFKDSNFANFSSLVQFEIFGITESYTRVFGVRAYQFLLFMVSAVLPVWVIKSWAYFSW